MTPADRARQILIDATVVATLHDTARTNMQLGQPGLPEHTPGAAPASGGSRTCNIKGCDHLDLTCSLSGDDGGVTLTATERLGTTPDPATRDLAALDEHVRQAAYHLDMAAMLAIRWQPGITATDVKTGLQERLDEIWCPNCAKAGIRTTKAERRTECWFCSDFRTRGNCGLNNPNQHPAPPALLEIHERRSINSADVTRCMTAAYGPAWNRKMKAGKKGRAA